MSVIYEYKPLNASQERSIDVLDDEIVEPKPKHSKLTLVATLLAVSFVFLLGMGIGTWNRNQLLQKTDGKAVNASQTCQAPVTRREWRSLSNFEKQGYITAVQCLRKRPSILTLNQSLYDYFPWIHSRVGEYSHQSAAFLAWHRYFIHVHESTLRDQCGYKGSLAYWDWTLDWQDITKAPIWDSYLGFGGHCIVDGPFENLQVLYLRDNFYPHCLSRGFANHSRLVELSEWIRPNAIERLLALHEYDSFNLGLENTAHIGIPRSIQGDFVIFTAPYDPVFFLHHTQLDRIWWEWQRRKMPSQARKYSGVTAHNSTTAAALTDVLRMGGLAPDVEVEQIIDTESGLLCYRY